MNNLLTLLLLIPTLFDIRNNNVEIQKDRNYIFVFICGIACKECYIDIDKIIQDDKYKNYTYCCVIYSQKGDVVSKKELIELYKQNINPDRFLFLKTKSDVLNFEKHLDNNYYPIIVTSINGKETLYKYNQIFGDSKTIKLKDIIKSLK